MSDKITSELGNITTEFKNTMSGITSDIADIKSQLKAANRPTIGGENHDAETKAFDLYLRKGKDADVKSMSALVPADGGYTVPKVIDSTIQKLMVDISPMRQVARVVSVSTPDFHIPFGVGGTAAAWVGEKDARPETNTSQIVDIVPSFGELYASPYLTQTILEDSQFDVAAFVADEVATQFAASEGSAFLLGDGVKKPKGLLTTATALTADATRAFGTAQHVTSGAAADITYLKLVALVHSLKARYRANAKWIMNKDTLGRVRSLVDGAGRPLVLDALGDGILTTIMGFEVVEMEDMPNVTAGANAILFGDFNRAYTIADRVGVSILYNPYISAPYVTYQSRMRVGGCVVDTQAYKVLKIGA